MAITIPEPYRDAVAVMAQIDVAARQALIDALDSAPDASSMQQLEAHVASATDLARRAIRAALSVTASLIAVEAAGDEERRSVAKGVAAAAARAELGGLVSEDPTALDAFAQFLFALMERQSVVGVAADVANLLYDHKNIYRNARVLTDFRPLFNDVQQPTTLRAGVIFHTLRLTMVSVDDGDSSLYVALDTADLHSLRRALDRAIAKDQVLRQRLTALELPLCDVSE